MERSDTEDDAPVDEDVKMVRAYVVRGSVTECFGFGLGITGALACRLLRIPRQTPPHPSF
jgi:hypothetical protein